MKSDPILNGKQFTTQHFPALADIDCKKKVRGAPSQSAPWFLIYQFDLIFFRVLNFKNIRLHQPCFFFKSRNHIFLLHVTWSCNLKEKRPGYLFLNNKKYQATSHTTQLFQLLTLYFALNFLDPIFLRAVGADWLDGGGYQFETCWFFRVCLV